MLYTFLLLLLNFAHRSNAVPKKSWGCSVSANTTLVPSVAEVVQVGSASFIHGELAEPWPAFSTRDGRRLRGFRYCFESEETKDLLTCKGNFWKALIMWSKALGRPGEESGHSFAWQEANNGEKEVDKFKTYFCYNDLRKISSALGMVWNDKVPDDTLIIRAVEQSTQSRATVGYKGVNQGKHPHELVIGTKSSTAVIAHEVRRSIDLL